MMVLRSPSVEQEGAIFSNLKRLSSLPIDEKPILLGLLSQDICRFWREMYLLAGFEIIEVELLRPGKFSKFIQSYFKL